MKTKISLFKSLAKSLALSLGLALVAQSASAQQVVTWTGGAGDALWGSSSNWANGVNPDGSSGFAVDIHFAGSTNLSPNNNYGTNTQFQQILFDSSASSFTLSGAAVKLYNWGGTAKIENNSSSLQTVSFNTSGVGIDFVGNGELDPTAGDLTINSGIIDDSGGEVRVWGDNGHTLTLNGALANGSGTLNFVNENNNTVVMTASNTYTGYTTVYGGELRLNQGANINSTSQIYLGGTNAASVATTTAMLTLGGTNQTLSAGITDQSGTITLKSSAVSGTNTVSGAIALQNGLTVTSSLGGKLALTGSISGAGGLTATGGIVTLTGSNSFTGGLVITSGTVTSNNGIGGAVANAAFGTGSIRIGDSATGANAGLLIGDWGSNYANAITVDSGAGTRTLTSTWTNSGQIPILTGSMILNNNLIVNSTGASGIRLQGNTSGTGGMIISNSGSVNPVRLSGANTFSGGVTVNQGLVELNSSTGLGTGMLTIGGTSGSSNATLNMTASVTGTNNITVAAGSTGTNSLINSSGNNNSFSGVVALNNSFTLAANSTGSITLSGNIVGGTGTNTITNSGTNTGGVALNGSIGNGTGTVAIVQNSTTSGLTIGTGSNSFSGGVTIKSGTLTQTGTAGALGTGTITLGDGVSSNAARLNGNFGTSGITNTNPITIASGGSGTYTIADINGSRDYSFSGNIALNNNLTFLTTGGGAMFISGTITGSSNITIDGNSNSGNGKFVSFSANNTGTFTGNIVVQNYGDFKVGSTTALGSSNAMTFDSTSKMDMGGLALTIAGLNDGPITAGTSTILNNGSGLTLGGTGSYSYSGVIANGGALIKTGTGSQTLSGFNTYTGNTTVSNGTLVVTGTLANTAVAVNGGTLSLGHAGAINQNTITVGGGLLTETVDNSIGGTAALTVTSGTANLANANNFSGAITINGGLVKLGNASALSTGTVGMSSGGGTLDLNGQSIANVLNISKAFTLMNSSASAAALTVDANVTNDFTINTTGSMTATRFIGTSATRTITKQGGGTVTTNGSSHNNLIAWNIQAGTVVLANTSGFGADRGVTLNGGTLQLSGANTDLINNGQAFIINSGIFDLNGKSETIAVVSGSAGGLITNTLLSSTSTVTVGGDNGNATYAGSLNNGSGMLALAKTGTGTQLLSGSSGFTGGTTVSQGILQIGNGNALGSGTATVTGTAALDLNGQTISNVLSLTGTGLNGNGDLINSNTGAGATVLGNIVNSSFTAGGAGNISLTKLNQANTGGTFTITKVGAGTLSLSGTTLNFLTALTLNGGTVILNKANADTTFDWAIDRGATINSGTMQIGATGEQIQTDQGVTVNGGAFDLGGFSTSLNFVSGSGGIVTNSGSTSATLTVGATQFGSITTSGTFAGALQNGNAALALTKTGTSIFTVSGSNNYTGATTISAGTVQLGNTYALGATSGVSIGSGAALDLNGQTTDRTFAAVSGTGNSTSGAAITNSNAAAASITGAIGTTSSNPGNFTVGGTGDISLGTVTSASTFTVTKIGNNTLNINGGADNQSLTLALTSGTVVLNNSVGHGASIVNQSGGYLKFGTNNSAAGQISSMNLNAGTFDLNGHNDQNSTVFTLSGSAGGIITNKGATDAVLYVGLSGQTMTGTNTIASTIQDGSTNKTGLTFQGGSSSTRVNILSGNNTYTGATTVSAGTLIVSGSISGSTTTVASGAILASGNNITSTTGAVNVNDGGTLDVGSTGGVGKLTTGALTLGSSNGTAASLKMELGGTTAGTQHDQVTTGATSLNLLNVNLVGSLINGFTPTSASYNSGTNQLNLDGSKFFLVLNTNTVTGTFANATGTDANLTGYNTIIFSGQVFAISYSANAGTANFTSGSGNDIALMAIPEPSTYAMILGGFGLLLGFQRARHRNS